jgi:hypothetical protein
MKTEQKVMIACTNANGESDMFVCAVEVSDSEYQNGVHYDLAKVVAEENGYEAPYVCFDQHEQKNLARKLSMLECPIPFTLEDNGSEEDATVCGQPLFGWDGISVQLNGYSDFSSVKDKGIVAYLEYWGGSVNLRAYGDIDSEDPTDCISLEGARNECRKMDGDLIEAEYISEWEEGDIYTPCEIDVNTLEIINLQTIDCDYQHLESERVDITFKEKIIQLDAEGGNLTEQGKKDLKLLLLEI